MNWLAKFLSSEPAVFWTSAATLVIATVQADPSLGQELKNYITLGVTLGVGAIIRQGVTPIQPPKGT